MDTARLCVMSLGLSTYIIFGLNLDVPPTLGFCPPIPPRKFKTGILCAIYPLQIGGSFPGLPKGWHWSSESNILDASVTLAPPPSMCMCCVCVFSCACVHMFVGTRAFVYVGLKVTLGIISASIASHLAWQSPAAASRVLGTQVAALLAWLSCEFWGSPL